MDLRKRLLDKIREQQFAAPGYAPVFLRNGQQVVRQHSINGAGTSPTSTGSPPTASVGSPTATNVCNELVWKIIDNCREQLQSLAASNGDDPPSRSPSLQRDYVAKWNTAVWPLLDVAIMLNTTFSSPTHRRQESNNDYALRREIQQLLSTADDTSPIRRYFQQSPPSPGDVASLLYQHYLSAAEQLGQLGSMIATGSLVEDQLVYVLRQYRTAATNFSNQIVPQVLNSEAIRVRGLEQQRHTSAVDPQQPASSRAPSPSSSDASASSKTPCLKMSDHLNEFRTLLDWCFALVGTLLNNTIEMLNQTVLYAETNRYFAIMHNELQGIVPTAVMGLCRFVLWVSNQPPMIMVTKTEFSSHCVLLNNYFAYSDHLHMQIVAESTAHEIQQKCFLKHTSLVGTNSEPSFPSAGVLVMKKFDPFASAQPATQPLRRTLSTVAKRRRRSRAQPASTSTPTSAVSSPPSANGFGNADDDDAFVFVNGNGQTKNDDYHAQNAYSQERLDVGWRFDQGSKMVVAEAEQACCTDRNLTSDASTSGASGAQATSADRQRDIYYLHCWTKVAIFGTWYNVHTLSLPFVIPTRKNQDLQLHRMLKSYSATIFWLHVAGKQDGFLIEWNDYMTWAQFSQALNVYFMREARVGRGLSDFDFMLLKEKAKCLDCSSDCNGQLQADKLAYQNIICPHLFYQCGERPLLKHSLWRALLDLIQLFQNDRTKVRELWERGVLGGLWSMDSVTKILSRHARPVLMSRISLLSGGSIVISFLSGNASGESCVVHTEPLDQQQLARRNLTDCIADIAESEGIEFVLDYNLQPILSTALLPSESQNRQQPLIGVRANSDQLGCPNTHRQYTFHALKLSIVACRRAQNGQRRPPLITNEATTTMRQTKTETAASILVENDRKNFETELRDLMQRYGFSRIELANACQKLMAIECDTPVSR